MNIADKIDYVLDSGKIQATSNSGSSIFKLNYDAEKTEVIRRGLGFEKFVEKFKSIYDVDIDRKASGC